MSGRGGAPKGPRPGPVSPLGPFSPPGPAGPFSPPGPGGPFSPPGPAGPPISPGPRGSSDITRPPSSPRGASVPEWPDDDTFAGGAPRAIGISTPSVSAAALLEEPALLVGLTLIAGASGAHRTIDHTRIQKSGLALAGHFHGIVPSRIQILGQTEQSYVNDLDPANRRAALEGFFGLGLSCVILTGSLGPSTAEFMAHAEHTGTPLLHSAERSSVTITALHALLDERLAPRKRLHGVLIDVFGVGLLIVGSSGVGKSECALDLVMRGHRLVADDVVECDYRPPGMIFGAPAERLRHLLEVRGLGILNIKDLFGVTAIRERKRIDVVARLAGEGKHAGTSGEVEIDRLPLDDRFHEILGVSIPELLIPVRPGRDMASILEVAARNELLKNAGHHATRELFASIESAIGNTDGDTPKPGVAARVSREPPPSSDPSWVRARSATQPRPVRPPMVSEHEINRGNLSAFVSRSDESAMPPPVGGGPWVPPRRR
ncbi:MAG: HPr(Ser) kinase/phosphatase [Polyangiaceae bacterium]